MAEAQRWTEVTPSAFPHEAEGLSLVRALLPPHSPFRAWSNFEFRDGHGKWHEVDLLVLGRRQLHLVELKYYSGTLRGDDNRWLRDGRRAEDSPLKLAHRKAQRLASKLQDELRRWANEHGHQIPDVRKVIPYVQESVFLHHPGLRCALPAGSTFDLFGLDGNEGASNLPGISQRLLEPAANWPAVSVKQDGIIAALLQNIGVVQRRQREIGSWVIDEEPLGEGEGWQDWPAFHRVATTDRVRIRFHVTPPGATTQERQRIHSLADHEYRIMRHLSHEGMLRPRDMVEGDLGVGLVYPLDERFQRLDLYLAVHAGEVPVTDQLSILRQVAETVGYAHGSRVVHRGLTPRAIYVRPLPDDGLRVLVGDWQSAGTSAGATLTGVSSPGVTGLLGAADNAPSTGPTPGAKRLAAVMNPAGVDPDRRQAEVFAAPEGVWNATADRVRLDVFALGALAYYLLTSRQPASDRTSLRDRIRRDDGLDVAADLPQASSALRTLILEATRPAVSERLPDVSAFLERLAAADKSLRETGEDAIDPLDASPGAVIGGRFELIRRLGAGSTAVGLLVTDLSIGKKGPDAERVLKVAIDDAAATRLTAEAEVLATLKDPCLVRLVEGPIEIGCRRALVLESAGAQTLGEVLRTRTRLSLDLLERWGTDLLTALVALDRAGVDHRDIKPANLGVREGRGNRTKHLVLFDFSLSRAGATALTAGTPPYLDPFLDADGRGTYDSAAERYAAAAVLFEMATGSTPSFGDGLSDPASIPAEATVDESMFDPSAATDLTTFFRRALARRAKARHDTAADMLAAWRAIFSPLPTTIPDDADVLADAAAPSTPLRDAGLSARALSALEPFGVGTVADLIALDPVRLNHFSGVADSTRREVKGRAHRWRQRLASAVTGRGALPVAGRTGSGLPDPTTAAALLLAAAGTGRGEVRRTTVRLLLGLDPGLDAFASQVELAVALDVSRARVAQLVAAAQEAWGKDPASRDLLSAVAASARQSLVDLGGVATVDELSSAVLVDLAPTVDGPGDAPAGRVAAGILRLALDRVPALDGADQPLSTRRRSGRIALLATDAALLDAADAMGRTADELVAAAHASPEPVVTPRRAVPPLRDTLNRVAGDHARATAATGDARLLRLAAALSDNAAVSGADELHHRDLAPTMALALALQGIGGSQPITAQEMRDRVRARFPSLPLLPDRPRLDQLVEEAGLGLLYDETERAFRAPTRAADTAGLLSRPATRVLPAGTPLVAGGRIGHRLSESASARSFLALAVEAAAVDKTLRILTGKYGATVVDLTGVLISAMRASASEVGLAWEAVRAADAAAPGTREAAGLAVLVQRALPAIDSAIEAASSEAADATRPVLLTEAAPLARYGHLATLSRWTDLTTRRSQAVWLLVPQLLGNQGAVIDKRPLPLAAPGQFLSIDADWLDSRGPAVDAGVVEGALT